MLTPLLNNINQVEISKIENKKVDLKVDQLHFLLSFPSLVFVLSMGFVNFVLC
jgi:hypothetical protein